MEEVSRGVVRTSESRFEGLADWAHKPSYFTSSLFGLHVRMAYYDLHPPPGYGRCTDALMH